MCGIACIAGDYTDTDKEEFKNMLDAMNYRGPDESSIKATPQRHPADSQRRQNSLDSL